MRLILTCLLGFSLMGCGGGFLSTARTINYQAATVLAETDRSIAPQYRKASEEALEASQSLEEYEGRMEPWNRVEEALRASYEALKAFEAILDAYEAGSEGNVLRAVLDVAEAIDHLLTACVALGLDEAREVLQLHTDLIQFFRQPEGQ